MQGELTGSHGFRTVVTAALLFAALLPAAAQDRIVRPIETSQRAALRGNVHPLARPEFDEGKAAGSMMVHRMVLAFKPSAAQQADLEALLSEQQNPLSPHYHQWLTPEQYAERFGLSENDIAKVVDWLQSQGFTVDETARSRTYVAFSGAAAQVESVFGTAIHQFTLDGEPHYANVSDPMLPAPLADIALSLRGLNDFRPKARGGVGRTSPRPRFTSSISGSHFLTPDDFATIYDLKPLYASGIDGTGQKLAVMGQTDLIMSDIATFRSLSGLPATTVDVRLVTGSADPGVVSGDIGEASLDVEWSGAVARNATIVYVNSKNGAFDSLSFAISQNLAPVISISYGDCEANFSASEISALTALGQQANTQGQTIVASSGDSGAADCDFPPNATTQVKSATHGLAVDVPAALPTVTGAGGTTFSEGSGLFWITLNNSNSGSAITYIPETAWNDTTFEIANGGSLAATGGGVSKLFTKPAYQAGTGVPADGQRDVPDISFSSSFDNDGYLMCSQGNCVNGFRKPDNSLLVVGGTSAAAPVFAGIVALINQQMNAAQGNVNPRLYQLAATSPDAFHDITSGDNKVPCTAGTKDCPPNGGIIGFSAGVGYDPVTGLGSVDAYNLVSEWSTTGAPPANLKVTATASATNQYNVTVAPINGFIGTVNLSVAGLPTGATASFGTTSVVINSTAAQSTTVSLASGTGTVSGTYVLGITGSAGKLIRSTGASAQLTGTADFQVSASPAALVLTAGTTGNVGTSTITVSPLNGFNDTVFLTCAVSSSLPGTKCAVSPAFIAASGTATVTVTAPATLAALRTPRSLPRYFPWTDGAFALAMGLMIAGNGERSSRKKLRLAILIAVLLAGLAMMAGCGGGGTSSAVPSTSPSTTTTAQTGTIIVQGSMAVLAHPATITVTVH